MPVQYFLKYSRAITRTTEPEIDLLVLILLSLNLNMTMKIWILKFGNNWPILYIQHSKEMDNLPMSVSVLIQFSTWYFCCPDNQSHWDTRKAPWSSLTNTGCLVWNKVHHKYNSYNFVCVPLPYCTKIWFVGMYNKNKPSGQFLVKVSPKVTNFPILFFLMRKILKYQPIVPMLHFIRESSHTRR